MGWKRDGKGLNVDQVVVVMFYVPGNGQTFVDEPVNGGDLRRKNFINILRRSRCADELFIRNA